MSLYLKLDQNKWVAGDFTDSTSYDLSGTVYLDERFTTTVDISSYTAKFLLVEKTSGEQVYSTTTGLTTTGSVGIFLMKFGSTATIYSAGVYKVRLLFTNSTNRLTTLGVNGSDELYVERNTDG